MDKTVAMGKISTIKGGKIRIVILIKTGIDKPLLIIKVKT
jgi:hypothetical protein